MAVVGVKLEDFEEIKSRNQCFKVKLTQYSSTKSAQKELNVVSRKQFLCGVFCVTNSNFSVQKNYLCTAGAILSD